MLFGAYARKSVATMATMGAMASRGSFDTCSTSWSIAMLPDTDGRGLSVGELWRCVIFVSISSRWLCIHCGMIYCGTDYTAPSDCEASIALSMYDGLSVSPP